MIYRILVQKDLCISSGKCVGDAADLFGFDADELAEPLVDQADVPLERLLRIARTCPGEAISVVDEHGTKITGD
jgi:ferredoxin